MVFVFYRYKNHLFLNFGQKFHENKSTSSDQSGGFTFTQTTDKNATTISTYESVKGSAHVSVDNILYVSREEIEANQGTNLVFNELYSSVDENHPTQNPSLVSSNTKEIMYNDLYGVKSDVGGSRINIEQEAAIYTDITDPSGAEIKCDNW